MNPMFSLLIFIAGVALIGGLFGLGVHILDKRSDGLAIRKRRVKELEAALDQVEQVARDQLIINPSDLTAHQVCTVLNKSRRRL